MGCLLIRLSRLRRSWRRSRSRIGPFRNGSACEPATRSVTTLRGVTGEEPSSSFKFGRHDDPMTNWATRDGTSLEWPSGKTITSTQQEDGRLEDNVSVF